MTMTFAGWVNPLKLVEIEVLPKISGLSPVDPTVERVLEYLHSPDTEDRNLAGFGPRLEEIGA